MYVKKEIGGTDTYMTGTGFTLFTIVQWFVLSVLIVMFTVFAVVVYLFVFGYCLIRREPKPVSTAFDRTVSLWPSSESDTARHYDSA